MKRLVRSLLSTIATRKELYKPFRMQKLFFYDRDDITIFDVGAYVGQITKIYRGLFRNATIYSFEPFPDSFEALKQTSEGYPTHPYQMAVADCAGKTKFNVNTDPKCNSFYTRPTQSDGEKYYPNRAKFIGQIEVETTSVDEFCDAKNISRIDILKLDVEGAEKRVLKGATRRLSEHSIGLIYSEVMFVPHYEGGCSFQELSVLLCQYGYTLFDFYNLKRAKNRQLRYANAIFLSPELRKQYEKSAMSGGTDEPQGGCLR